MFYPYCFFKYERIINPNNLGFLYKFAKKYIHINIFHNNGTAMVSSQLFLIHVFTVILGLNMCIWVNNTKYRQEERIYRQIQCVEAKYVTYFTAHWPVICWLASCVGVSHFECCLTWRTVFFAFDKISIPSLYLLAFCIYHSLKGTFELLYYLYKKSVCQMVIEVSGAKVAGAFLHKVIFNRRGSRKIWLRGN